jgi:hypothetical protein
MDTKEIEAWATKNKEDAKTLGLRLIEFRKDPDGLKKQPSLGDFQDSVQEWAIDNPRKATMLLFKLMKVVTS